MFFIWFFIKIRQLEMLDREIMMEAEQNIKEKEIEEPSEVVQVVQTIE